MIAAVVGLGDLRRVVDTGDREPSYTIADAGPGGRAEQGSIRLVALRGDCAAEKGAAQGADQGAFRAGFLLLLRTDVAAAEVLRRRLGPKSRRCDGSDEDCEGGSDDNDPAHELAPFGFPRRVGQTQRDARPIGTPIRPPKRSRLSLVSSRRPSPRSVTASPPPPGTPLQVEALGGEGDGRIRGPDGQVWHVAGVLPGERVRLQAGREGPVLSQIETPSPDRRTPPCVHFGACGGCALQHWDDEAALAWKAERLRATLALERLETEILPVVRTRPGERRRAALHVRRGPSRREARIGFKARRSWSLVEISECAVLHPGLVQAMPLLRRLAAPLLEHPRSAPALHVTLTDTGLDIDVTGVEARSGGLSADARQAAAEIAAEGELARLTLAGDILFQQRQPRIRFGDVPVILPPGAFLQASAAAEAAMVHEVLGAVTGARRIADLFCGLGAFTFPLARYAPVLAVDGSAPAVAALSAALGSAPGLHGVTAEARDLFRRPLPAADLKRTDAIVFDPPRAGALAQASEFGASGAATVVAVSCNPSTFARDARRLTDDGFRLERVLPVDQFLWSPHLELVGVFGR